MKRTSIFCRRMLLGLVIGLGAGVLTGCGQNPEEAQAEFFAAVKLGDLKTATSLVQEFPEFLQATDRNLQASHWAAQFNHAEVLRMLLEKGANINAQARGTDGLVEYAIGEEAAKAPVMKVLLENGIDVNQTNSSGRSLLMRAASFGNLPLVQLLLDSGANVNATDEKGNGVLHHAVTGNNPEVVVLLLEKGAAPAAKNAAGRTALQEAMGEEEARVREDSDNPGEIIVEKVWVESEGPGERGAVIEVLKKHPPEE